MLIYISQVGHTHFSVCVVLADGIETFSDVWNSNFPEPFIYHRLDLTNQLNQCSYLQRIALKGTTQTNQISAVICSVSHSKVRHKPTKSVQLSAAYPTQSYDTNQPNQCSYLQRIPLKVTTQTNQISAVHTC